MFPMRSEPNNKHTKKVCIYKHLLIRILAAQPWWQVLDPDFPKMCTGKIVLEKDRIFKPQNSISNAE